MNPSSDRSIGAALPGVLAAVFREEPGVGFALVDKDGVVIYVNAKSAELFLQDTPQAALGRRLDELFGPDWAAERMRLFAGIAETGRPTISRHIRHGKQIQSTLRLLTDLGDENPVFIVMTVEGEHDPETPEDFDFFESELAHLGPLNSLSPRELEVLALIGHGMTTAAIAKALHRSVRTVERHCDAIRQKLNSANRVQVADFARKAGLRVEDAKKKRL